MSEDKGANAEGGEMEAVAGQAESEGGTELTCVADTEVEKTSTASLSGRNSIIRIRKNKGKLP